MATWHSDTPPPRPKIGPLGWVLAAIRGGAIVSIILSGLVALFLLRLPEQALSRKTRPWSGRVPQLVCRAGLRIMGLRVQRHGMPMTQEGAAVANHSSWLDIFVLNASDRVFFVSKADVAGWPGIGWLARATGTVFIRRDPRDAGRQKQIFEQRLHLGHRLLFFPEGTSSDGRRVLPFKSTLFAAFFDDGLREDMWIQPITVAYTAPPDCDARFYGWWGDMDFGPHFITMLASWRHGGASIYYHAPLKVADFDSRKTLAAAAEQAVRRESENFPLNLPAHNG